MSNNIKVKQQFVKNNIPNQTLSYANQLTTQQWNTIINTLTKQTNDTTTYLQKLHQWLIGYNNTADTLDLDGVSFYSHVLNQLQLKANKTYVDTQNQTLFTNTANALLSLDNKKADKTSIPTKVSDLENDADYTTKEYVNQLTAGSISIIRGEMPTKVSDLENDANYVDKSLLGTSGGVATLDTNGRVPTSQLPSYVDDVIEFEKTVDGKQWKENALATANGSIVFNNTTASNLEGGKTNKYYRVLLQNVDGTETNLKIIKPEAGKIYVLKTSGVTFRWSGSNLVEISKSLALGETSSTAYAGNKGKANAEAITQLQNSKANSADLEKVETRVNNLEENKADQSYLDNNFVKNSDFNKEVNNIKNDLIENYVNNETLSDVIDGVEEYVDEELAKKADKTYVDTKVANLVNSAPEALDTLNELSKSLGNDPNFATTVTKQIGKKANKEDIPTKLSQLEQDIELGVEESEVLNIIDNNSQEVEELTFGNNSSVNWEDDTQVPSSKSVKEYVDSVLGDVESLLGGI